MNREIKFKFWNTATKQMERNLLTSCNEYQNPFTRNDIIPLEYTGLKDRHGKEAYEGDIISYHYCHCRGNPLNRGTATICWDIESAGFRLINTHGNKITILGMMQDAEIIGNIYEGIKNEAKS